MHAPQRTKGGAIIEAVNANLFLKSGETELHILKDINLTIAPAEVVAIAGPSGSGKTSLLMLLAGLERTSSGTIRVDGEDLSRLDEDRLAIFRRKTLGILFQNIHLIPSLTALENVRLGLEIAEVGMPLSKMTEISVAALEDVGLGERLSHLPRALSGGEQQRVGLARALVTEPKLLLADEPTGNLDQDTGARVIELMFNMARQKGAAVVLITHDMALAKRADRQLIMDRGQLTEATVRRK